MLPELRTVLARQRRDYGLDKETFPPTFPVEEQATNIDDTPVHNISMERFCGTVDYRLKKLGTLGTVSRSVILDKTRTQRASSQTPMKSFREAALANREIELSWSSRMKEKFAEGADEKQVIAQMKERKRLDMLEELKSMGGPFTNLQEVEVYLKGSDVDKKRLKKELQFARDSSVTLPRVDPLFRVQVTLPNKQRRDKTATEFGESLMVYLGKKGSRSNLEYQNFKQSLEKFIST